MLQHFQSFIKQHSLFNAKDKILLAVSGGADSVVMADLFYNSGLQFGIAHCNFRLRGSESDAEEKFVETLASKFRVPYFAEHFDTSAYATDHKISVQMAARELRYKWFEEIRASEEFDFIATAHHLDDQVETFLINLVRGTGISGLHGILPKQGLLIRPLLFAFRSDIADYAKSNHIGFCNDSSNAEDKYLRNKFRLKVIPLLEEINPDFRRTLSSEIAILRDWEAIGRKSLKENIPVFSKVFKDKTIVDLKLLAQSAPHELYAWELLSGYGFNSSVVGDILANSSKNSGRTFLSLTHRAVIDRGSLIIQSAKPERKEQGRMISEKRKNISWPVKLRFTVAEYDPSDPIHAEKETASLDFDKLSFPLELRNWKPGDSFHPFGMKGKKKISDFLIDEKVSLPDKENTWVLCSSGKIAWVVGKRIDHRFRITHGTSRIFRITMQVAG